MVDIYIAGIVIRPIWGGWASTFFWGAGLISVRLQKSINGGGHVTIFGGSCLNVSASVNRFLETEDANISLNKKKNVCLQGQFCSVL